MLRQPAILSLAIWIISLLSTHLYAGDPTEKLKMAISGVQKLTSENRDFSKPEDRALLREQVETFFSPEHIARRALARGWNELDESQQKTFIDSFSELLILTYASQLNEGGDSTINYLKELPLGTSRMEVHTEAVSDGTSLEIQYRMLAVEDDWQVYDVVIEGVSLVSNYRSQFTSLLQRKGPEGLIETLQSLVAKRTE